LSDEYALRYGASQGLLDSSLQYDAACGVPTAAFSAAAVAAAQAAQRGLAGSGYGIDPLGAQAALFGMQHGIPPYVYEEAAAHAAANSGLGAAGLSMHASMSRGWPNWAQGGEDLKASALSACPGGSAAAPNAAASQQAVSQAAHYASLVDGASSQSPAAASLGTVGATDNANWTKNRSQDTANQENVASTDRQQQAKRNARRRGGADASPPQIASDVIPNWSSVQDAAKPDLRSTEDFPTLGGGSSPKAVELEAPAETGGFWERPARPITRPRTQAAGTEDPAIAGEASSRPTQGSNAVANATITATAEVWSESSRRTRLEELANTCGLELEEPVLGFILSQSSGADVLDYLQAYSSDNDAVRRFAEGFTQQKLGTQVRADIDKVKVPDVSKKDSNDNGSAKVGRKRRVKGREVDPALLGFTAMPHKGSAG